MPLTKSTGNMYPWVTHTHCHLGGQCPHGCSYCYVDNPRFGRPAKYKGELRLIEDEFKVNYGTGKVIFIENNNDLFAEAVPTKFIERILNHCCDFSANNIYVFQTKNAERMFQLWDEGDLYDVVFPHKTILGCTIESNRHYPSVMVNAPPPMRRYFSFRNITHCGVPTPRFLTIEPILDFDLVPFVCMIKDCAPTFINIGADSKGHNLPEPPIEKVNDLIAALTSAGIEIRQKHNLDRLAKRQAKAGAA